MPIHDPFGFGKLGFAGYAQARARLSCELVIRSACLRASTRERLATTLSATAQHPVFADSGAPPGFGSIANFIYQAAKNAAVLGRAAAQAPTVNARPAAAWPHQEKRTRKVLNRLVISVLMRPRLVAISAFTTQFPLFNLAPALVIGRPKLSSLARWFSPIGWCAHYTYDGQDSQRIELHVYRRSAVGYALLGPLVRRREARSITRGLPP